MSNQTLEASRPQDVAGNLEARIVSSLCGIVKALKRIYKDPSEPLLPYIYRAELSNHTFQSKGLWRPVIASGKGFTEATAKISALGEAIERYSAACWRPEQIVYARRSELKGRSLDPRELVLYRKEQYAQLPYAPYTEEAEMGWVRGAILGSTESIWIPALAVFLSYKTRSPAEFICPVTSNGLAAGATVQGALLHAILEVVERDAFMIMWHNRLRCERVEIVDHPDAGVRDLVECYRRRGVVMELYRIPTDRALHVFLALGVQTVGPGPAVVTGLGAHVNAASAARSAVLEVAQVRPALRVRMRDSEVEARLAYLLHDPARVSELEDHDLLYASPHVSDRFDFIRASPMTTIQWEDRAEGDDAALAFVSKDFAAVGQQVLYADVTPHDVAALPIHTVRAVIPGYQPIYFGWTERRLGGDRLFDLPRALGLRAARTAWDEINQNPHPLS